MATEEELQLEYEYAKAKAQAEVEQGAKLEAEHKANASVLPSHIQETQGYSTAGKLADATLNPSGMTVGVARGVANAGTGLLKNANAIGHSIGSGLGKVYDEYAPSIGLSPRDPESVQAAQDQANKEQEMFQQAEFKPRTKEEQIWQPVGQVGGSIALGGAVGSAVKQAVPVAAGKIAGYVAGSTAGSAAGAATIPNQEGLVVRSDGMAGFEVHPNDDASTQQTKKFLNQTLDNMVLGVAGETAYALGRKGVEVVKNVGRNFGVWNKLPAIQQQAAEDVLSVYAQLGEHPTAAQQQQAAEKVLKVIDQNGIDKYNFGDGVGEKTVQKDTVSTLNAGLDDNNPFDQAIKTKMEALRSSAKRGNAPQTDVRLQEPKNVLNQGLKETQAVRGGDQAIDQTKQVLQDRAMSEAQTTDIPVQNAKNDLAQESYDFTDTLKKDPSFGASVRQSEQGGVPLDIHKTEEGLKNKIVDTAGAAQQADKAVRDSAYKAVAATGAPAKMDEFLKVFEDNKVGLSPDIQALVEKADGSYGYLYNQIRPRLSKAIGDAYSKNLDASGLMALKRNIDEDQLAWLAESGNNVTVQAAKKAAEANKVYSAKWNDTVGKELRINKNNNKFSPGTLQEKGRDIVDSTISNPNRTESVKNLKDILGPGNEGLVADTALAKATRDMRAGRGVNTDKITSDLQQMANSFGPEHKARLEGFLTDVKNKKITIEELQKKIPELEQTAAAEKEQIFGEKFPELFEKVGGKRLPKGSGYKIFDDAMNAGQPRVIDALITEAKKNPEDLAGLETAWLKSAETKINGPKQAGHLEDNFVENGKKIFGEDSPEIKAITSLREYTAKLESSLNKPGTESIAATENQKNFRGAVALVQTFVFGVLNPTAARINKITSNLAESYNSTGKSHMAIDNILSDNQAMKSAMKDLIYKSKTRMSPAMWKTLWTAGAKMGLYANRPDSEINIQTEQALH